MQTVDEFKELITDFVDKAEKQLIKDNELLPVCLLITHDNELIIIPMNFSDNKEKNKYSNIIKIIAAEINAQMSVFISETWTISCGSEKKSDEIRKHMDQGGSLENVAGRNEVLCVSGESRDGFSAVAMNTILRDSENKITGLEKSDFEIEMTKKRDTRFQNILDADLSKFDRYYRRKIKESIKRYKSTGKKDFKHFYGDNKTFH